MSTVSRRKETALPHHVNHGGERLFPLFSYGLLIIGVALMCWSLSGMWRPSIPAAIGSC